MPDNSNNNVKPHPITFEQHIENGGYKEPHLIESLMQNINGQKKIKELESIIANLQIEAEKNRKEVEGLREYAAHKFDCELQNDIFSDFAKWCKENPNADWAKAHIKFMDENKAKKCTCGLDQLLTTNPKEERK